MRIGKVSHALAFGIGLMISTQSVQAKPLDDEGLKREIIGRVLSASMGFMSIRVLHRADGTSVMRGSMGGDEGRWQIKNSKICVRWQNRNSGNERCMSLEPLGNGKYRSSMRGIVLTAEK